MKILGFIYIFFLSNNTLAADWKLQDQYIYQTKKEKFDKSIVLNGKNIRELFSWELTTDFSLVANQQEDNNEFAFLFHEFAFKKHGDSTQFEIGMLNKNLSHIDAISFLSKNSSLAIVNPEILPSISSPSLYFQKYFDNSKFQFLWQFEKSKYHFINKNEGVWYPDNRITNLNFDDVLLLLPEEANFSIADNRELEAASLNNISLKWESNIQNWDLGFYSFYGASSPSYFYSFTASVTNADGSVITAQPGIKVIPTYFKELAVAHFGSYQFEESILKWELGLRKDQSDIDYIDLNETNFQLQYEWNQFIKNISLRHYTIFTYTNSKNDLSYKLSPFDIIYALNFSSESPWSFDIRKSESMKYSTSGHFYLASNYQWSDNCLLKLSYMYFHSDDKDLINMYNEKDFVRFEWQLLF